MHIVDDQGIALDSFQSDSCSIADAVELWNQLGRELTPKLMSPEHRRMLAERMAQALHAEHFVANLMLHKYFGAQLSAADRDKAMDWVAHKHPALVHPYLCSLN